MRGCDDIKESFITDVAAFSGGRDSLYDHARGHTGPFLLRSTVDFDASQVQNSRAKIYNKPAWAYNALCRAMQGHYDELDRKGKLPSDMDDISLFSDVKSPPKRVLPLLTTSTYQMLPLLYLCMVHIDIYIII